MQITVSDAAAAVIRKRGKDVLLFPLLHQMSR